ncbi:NAD-dependent deacylase [Taibaiella lutea]|uniref:protein acetyllysine N-acetyltransferase n=1 Tax=Taibaiella lutea TaxID=2608001 RepID=A0A5M6CNZ6_9BACT|nr:Sir2 family NAD-dependent protein deacetylase [Taibaiella lutea]KAA5534975.1 NAD-dependent deacylase [Taibaiella lutea]
MEKKKIVILTGAGMSAESGLRTFRDGDGLWEEHHIEDVATPEAWQKDRSLVQRFYNERRKSVLQAQPNDGHKGLALLEQRYDVHIVTQNIDDLHERAGSTKVMHLHGEILTMRSEKDRHSIYPITEDIKEDAKAVDGSYLRPNIVWFGEEVPMIEKAIPLMEAADIFILVGSSLAVYPAAGLLHYVDASVPKYIIDKKIPKVSIQNVIPIEKPATEGVAELLKILMP